MADLVTELSITQDWQRVTGLEDDRRYLFGIADIHEHASIRWAETSDASPPGVAGYRWWQVDDDREYTKRENRNLFLRTTVKTAKVVVTEIP